MSTPQLADPTLVLPDCPARTHNTLYAAKRADIRCHCPGALAKLKEHRAREHKARPAHKRRCNPTVKQVSPDTDARNVEMWHKVHSDGQTQRDIAAEYALSPQTVHRILRQTLKLHPDLVPDPVRRNNMLRVKVGRTPLDVVGIEPVEVDRSRAECRDSDPELWFEDGRGRLADRVKAAAKAICRRCPVQGDCLTEAVQQEIVYGIWGGLEPLERRSARRVHLEMREIETGGKA